METISEIITDMRKRFETYAKSDSNDARYMAYLGYAEFANRIEKAVTNCKQLKMREALMQIFTMSDQWYFGVNTSKSSEDLLIECGELAENALSAPPRNCDLHTTEIEASKEFIAWYNTVNCFWDDKWNEVSSFDLKHNVDGILHDYIRWLFAEAKGETK